MIWTVPNYVTFTRLLLVPLFVAIFFMDFPFARELSTLIFCIAAITDWLDGYLARKLQQTSPFGAFLDPVADKLIVAAALLIIAHDYESITITLAAIIMLCREIYISALREWMAKIGYSDLVKVGWIGKVKTTTQMIALIGLLSGLEYFFDVRIYWVTLGTYVLYVSAFLSLWSMFGYTKASWPYFTK